MAHRVRSDVHLLQEVANELEVDNNPTCTKDNINESYSGTADTASSSGRTSEVIAIPKRKLIKNIDYYLSRR
jgi:hypothetical protein